MIVNIFKAQPVIKSEPVEDVCIQIQKDIPDTPNYKEAVIVFRKEAEGLANALIGSLPGGTLDQLTILLLESKASQLRVVV
jgi:hypothetical protein